jgi:hypothetical protein
VEKVVVTLRKRTSYSFTANIVNDKKAFQKHYKNRSEAPSTTIACRVNNRTNEEA